MARYQYRISGELTWQSNSGNALFCLVNKLGSNKKITLRSLEVNPLTSTTTGTAGTVSAAVATVFALARATVSGVSPLSTAKMDTNGVAWPATVGIWKRATTSSSTSVIKRVFLLKQLNQASLSWMARQMPYSLLRGVHTAPRKDTALEEIVVRAGESIALFASTLNNSIPLRITATLIRYGSPNRTYTVQYFTSALADQEAVFALTNDVGSGEVVGLRDISVEEVGTYDSPYLQLVPVGATIESNICEVPSIVKMDTNNPDPSTWVDARLDAPILPFGVPENYLSDASTGSPKGFNYLKTKDFLGPVYRTLFPEYVKHRPGQVSDVLTQNSHRMADQAVRKAGITIREGEGIALVSAAETAAGATAAVGTSGWSSFEFAVTFDVEPKLSPTLTITGLKNPSEVRIFKAGLTTEVAGQENVTTGSFSWVFDPEENPSVDIAILSLGYQNLRLTSTALSLADLTIPVQQQIDRQYNNP